MQDTWQRGAGGQTTQGLARHLSVGGCGELSDPAQPIGPRSPNQSLAWFCQLVEAETLIERTDSLPCPFLSFKQPTPCP
jgi:hypothetical protein